MPPKHHHHQQQQQQQSHDGGNDYGSQGGGYGNSTGTSYGGGDYGGGSSGGGFNFSQIEQYAHEHAGGSGDSSLFSSAMSMISGNASSLQPGVNEQSMQNAHQSFFGGGDPSGATSGGIGQAAAMQALKMFGGSSGSNSGGDMKQQFMGMAMGQAAKLYDHQSSQGNIASGSKESAIQEAGEQALKMYMGSEMGGGSSSGLMSLASKFL